jgi:hypothetical protein
MSFLNLFVAQQRGAKVYAMPSESALRHGLHRIYECRRPFRSGVVPTPALWHPISFQWWRKTRRFGYDGDRDRDWRAMRRGSSSAFSARCCVY